MVLAVLRQTPSRLYEMLATFQQVIDRITLTPTHRRAKRGARARNTSGNRITCPHLNTCWLATVSKDGAGRQVSASIPQVVHSHVWKVERIIFFFVVEISPTPTIQIAESSGHRTEVTEAFNEVCSTFSNSLFLRTFWSVVNLYQSSDGKKVGGC